VHIDFLGIQAFLAVAECGTFGLAAGRLHLTQAAISHRMRKLEEALGTQLIVRTSRGVSLTQAGEALLPRAKQSLRQLEETWDVVRKHGRSAPAWVSFGCLPTLAGGVLVPLLKRVESENPGLQVRVFDSTPGEIVELVQSGTAAFGITVAQSLPADLSVREIGVEQFVLACPPGHRLCLRPGPATWADLRSERLIRISLPSGNSATIDATLGPAKESLNWASETQRTSMALEMVRAGMGVTVVPALALKPENGLVAVPLGEPGISRTLALVTPLGSRLGEPHQAIAEAAVELVQERLASGHGAPGSPGA
jgi:DNA-binding transcriptional LysR family regulator